MIDFSVYSTSTTLGKLLRLPLRLIPQSTVIPILQGELKGLRWIVGAGTHGCWLGTYELPKPSQFAAMLGKGQTVYDVGANVGFYTLLAMRCVGESGHVYSFEPLPENLEFLHRHLALNGFSRDQVYALAITDKVTNLNFERGSNRFIGHLDRRGDLLVAATTLDHFVIEQGNPVPHIVKIDVEGAELEVLRGACQLLETRRPILFLATHSPRLHIECCHYLRSAGYRLHSLDGKTVEETNEILCRPV